MQEASESLARMLGRRRADLLGRHVSEWDTHLSADQVAAWLTPLPLGEHRRFETAYRRDDGTTVLVEIEAVAAQIASDEWVYCSVRDITERKRLMRALVEARDTVQDLYDKAPCAYLSVDAAGGFTRVNALAAEWLGVDPGKLAGQGGLGDACSEDSRGPFNAAFQQLLGGRSVGPMELDLLNRRDGSLRRVRLTATVVTDDLGRFLSSHMVAHDISDMHRMRLELERVLQEQSAILDHSLVAVIRVKAGRASWTNPAAEHIFGYTREEFVGMTSTAFYVDDAQRMRIGQEAQAAIQAGDSYRVQLEMKRKDGTRLWVDMSIVGLAGSADDVLIMLADISVLKRAELLRIEATGLEAQNAVLVETARQKDLFLANMSHELRTPLNAVIGFSELLRSQTPHPDPRKRTHYATQINASGLHLLGLIDAMLDTARMEAGLIEFHPETIDLCAALDEVRQMVAPRCASRDITIDPPVVSPSVREVYLDSLRLRQMLLNLVDNAVKFSHPGGSVRLRVMPAGPGMFCLEVQDDGIGIAEGDQAALFVPFSQLSSGYSKTHEGTGLGLSLVRRLVEAQGGSISLTGQLGIGTVVRVTMPRSMLPSKVAPAGREDVLNPLR